MLRKCLFCFRCTPGHFCPNGSQAQLPCLPGSFQDEFYKDSCKQCPARYYCDSTIMNATKCSHGVQQPMPCPRGYYCPPGTKTATQFGCPNGMNDLIFSNFSLPFKQFTMTNYLRHYQRSTIQHHKCHTIRSKIL